MGRASMFPAAQTGWALQGLFPQRRGSLPNDVPQQDRGWADLCWWLPAAAVARPRGSQALQVLRLRTMADAVVAARTASAHFKPSGGTSGMPARCHLKTHRFSLV